MKKIIIASSNEGKIKEIKTLLKDFDFEILSMKDIGFNDEIVEDGKTFIENSMKKAKAVYDSCKEIVIADDSGLSVDALNGEPGVYSARYSDTGDSHSNIKKLLENLENVPYEKRTARFICAVAVIMKDGSTYTLEEKSCEGIIIDRMSGENGFGYDPVFYVPDHYCTMARLTEKEKNEISHRGRAFKNLKRLFL